jgi:AcrR family transcriptional regulator
MPRFKLRSPRQNRSRASFERVLDAAAKLLAEKGHERFTLLEVSRRAKVSIGSIYCRVDGKKNLFRAVDQRVLARFNVEHSELVAKAKTSGTTLPEIFPAILRGCGDFLKRNGSMVRALILLSQVDPFIGAEGGKSFNDLVTKVTALLLDHRDEIRHPNPDDAAHFAFHIAYGALNRHLGIGNVTGKPEKGDVGELIDGLTVMCCAFLSSDWEKLPGEADEYRIASAMMWRQKDRSQDPAESAIAG